ncbi:MAG: transporter substrate-binding domain-containing protein [Rhodoferax sp.]|nr:transporter substrate-binding domain-containing protein [Rhodoferax sp.]
MKTFASTRRSVFLATALIAGMAFTGLVQAQSNATLDKVLSAKTLRCGIQLDFPPAGFRNAQNEPDGYDVAYCKDMAKSLGVTAQVVETPSAERIPALVNNRIDVLIASTSITPARSMTVAFTQPYVSFVNVVLTNKASGVQKFADLKGRQVGGVTGTTTEQDMKAAFEKWKDPKGKYTGYGSESETFLALNQKKIDGVIVSAGTAAALVKSGQYPNLVVKGEAPTPADLAGIAVRKGDPDFLRWSNVFVWNQVRTGRYAELYGTYFGEGKAPALTVEGVDY